MCVVSYNICTVDTIYHNSYSDWLFQNLYVMSSHSEFDIFLYIR